MDDLPVFEKFIQWGWKRGYRSFPRRSLEKLPIYLRRPEAKICAQIDVVLDPNPARAHTSTKAADWSLAWIERESLTFE